MKVHKEGTGLLLTLFTIFFVVDVALYHTVGRGWVFYSTTFVTTVLFLLVLNFFRSPFRRFPFDSEGLVIAPADGTIVTIEEVMENEILHRECLQISIFMSVFNACQLVSGEWDCQACVTPEGTFYGGLPAEEQHGE